MADVLRHRGPDDQGYWWTSDRTFGLAHRRLSIIDVVGGHQPMPNEDGRVLAVFNGAIYNYRELREELVGRGHTFKTNSDTEVIVHLYEECGAALATKLRGMFAIAVWDDTQRQLLLIRDRVGKKPLYYSERGGEFVFASEIKGVVAAAASTPDIDEQAIGDYLTWACIPAPATIYQHVRSVQPGHAVVVRDRRIVRDEPYWRLQMSPKTRLSRVEAVERIDAHLREAVRVRLRADVPVGSFLSGGIDSGIITAIAAQEHPDPLTTITIGFEDGAFDERSLARQVAERYATDHHEIVVKPTVADDLPKIVRAYDQPFGSASAIPSFYVAQAARQFVKVVLNGDGGDEVFAGYRRYVAGWIAGLMPLANSMPMRMLCGGLSRLLPTPRGFRSGYAFSHRLLRGMGLSPEARQLAWTVDGFDAGALRALSIGHDSADDDRWALRLHRGQQLAMKALEDFRGEGAVDRMLGADFQTVLPHDLLVKMDIATMAHGLEARSPLLDHVLVDEVARYPQGLKLRGLRTKPLLRDLGARYLPKDILSAPKRGFEVPLIRWLRHDLRDFCADAVLARGGLLCELFDRKALERLLGEGFRMEPGRWSRRVWLLLMLAMWDGVIRRSEA